MPQDKAAFVKRVVTHGLPVLIGSGYYLDEGQEIEVLKTAVVAALDNLVAEVVAERPMRPPIRSACEPTWRPIPRSSAALLDRAGSVTTNPSVYRTADSFATSDLAMLPSYYIEAQAWFTEPLVPINHRIFKIRARPYHIPSEIGTGRAGSIQTVSGRVLRRRISNKPRAGRARTVRARGTVYCHKVAWSRRQR